MLAKDRNGKWKWNVGMVIQIVVILIPILFFTLTGFAKLGAIEEKVLQGERERLIFNKFMNRGGRFTEREGKWLKDILDISNKELREMRKDINNLTIQVGSLEKEAASFCNESESAG